MNTARRRGVWSWSWLAVVGLGLVVATGVSGCSGPFPGTFQECGPGGSCADTNPPRTNEQPTLAEGEDPVAAARRLSFVPAWASGAADSADPPGATCDGGRAEAGGAAPRSVGECLTKYLGDGLSVNIGWYVSTVEGDPIVTLARVDKDGRVSFVEVTAFDRFGGAKQGPLPEYVCAELR